MAPSGLARRRQARFALAILTTLCLLTSASAQSTDPDHPAPLGPGVNRGNVDNSGRGHTFYFFAGPGHIDIEMAFEEMGLFGSPLRQAMNFDFYNDDNSLASHNAIVSQGALARNHTDGDFPSRQRLRLVVTGSRGRSGLAATMKSRSRALRRSKGRRSVSASSQYCPGNWSIRGCGVCVQPTRSSDHTSRYREQGAFASEKGAFARKQGSSCTIPGTLLIRSTISFRRSPANSSEPT